jgi:phage replication O-like protein O
MTDQARHTRIPNAILDSMAELTEPELRVLLIITRKTIGWQKECDLISLTQLEKFTGLSRPAVNKALHTAIERGWVERTGRGKQGTGCYRLTAELVNDVNQLTEITSKPCLLGSVNDVNRSSPELVNDVNTQKKDLKEKKEKIRTPRKSAGVPIEKSPVEKSEHQHIMDAYASVLAYPIRDGPKEGNAAKWLVKNGYTAEQVQACYAHLKVQTFWREKHISLQTVASNIGAYLQSKNGHTNGKHLRPGVGQHSERKPQRETDLDTGF